VLKLSGFRIIHVNFLMLRLDLLLDENIIVRSFGYEELLKSF
jgi:hypothetical protein